MSLALPRQDRCGASAPCVLRCKRSRVCPAPHPYGFEPLLLPPHGAGPITKKAPIAGSSQFKLAEEEGFEPS